MPKTWISLAMKVYLWQISITRNSNKIGRIRHSTSQIWWEESNQKGESNRWKGIKLKGITLKGITQKGITLKGISLYTSRKKGITQKGTTLIGITQKCITQKGITQKGITLIGITQKGITRKGITLTSRGTVTANAKTLQKASVRHLKQQRRHKTTFEVSLR